MGMIRTTNKRHKQATLYASRHPAEPAPAAGVKHEMVPADPAVPAR